MPLLRAGELAHHGRDAPARPRAVRPPAADDLAQRRRCPACRTATYGGDRTRRPGRAGRGKPADVRRRGHRRRRRRPARLHLRHHRPAQGDHALPPRRARDRRHLLRARPAPEPDDVFTGTPPLGFHLRPRRPGGLPAARRRQRAAAREGRRPDQLRRRGRRAHGVTVLFTAPTAYRAMLAAGAPSELCRRCAAASPPARRCPAATWQAVPRRHRACGSSTASAPPRCCTSSSPRPTTTSGPAPPAAPSPATPPRSSTTTGNPVPDGTLGRLAVRGPTGCRYLADDRQAGLRPGRLEHHRRHLRPRRRRLLLVPGPHRRHDHLRRLQHRRAGGRAGAARPPGRRRVRRRRRPRRASAA